MCGQAVLGFGSGAFFVPGIRPAAQGWPARGAGSRSGCSASRSRAAWRSPGCWRRSATSGAGASTFAAASALPLVAGWCAFARLPTRLPAPVGDTSFRPVRRSSPWRWAERWPHCSTVRMPSSPLRGVRVGRLARHRRPRHHDLARPLRAREAPLRQRRRPRGSVRIPGASGSASPCSASAGLRPHRHDGGHRRGGRLRAFVAALGPVANVLALDAFEGRTQLLGAFRSVQIGFGAATSLLIGAGAALFGLQAALVVVAAGVPVALVVIGRGPRTREREHSVYS